MPSPDSDAPCVGVSRWDGLPQCQRCPEKETPEIQELFAEKCTQYLLPGCSWLIAIPC